MAMSLRYALCEERFEAARELAKTIMSKSAKIEEAPVDRWIVSDCALLHDGRAFSSVPLSIGIRGAKIAAVAPAQELRRGARKDFALGHGEEIIDVGENPVVPSFVNGHTHLAMAPLRGVTSLAERRGDVVKDLFFSIERHMKAEDVRVFARLGALESLLCGVGCVWDHYYFGEQVAEALAEAGLSGVVAPTLQDRSGPGADRFEAELEATARIDDNDRFAKLGIFSAVGPHASDTVSEELLGRAGDLARSRGLAIHLHLAQSVEEALAMRARPRLAPSRLSATFSGCPVLMAHGLYLTDAECSELARAGWVLAYCPYSQLQFGILSPFASWLGASGRFVVGTDCVASNDALDPQRELPLVAGEAALGASFSRPRRAHRAGDGLALVQQEQARRDALERITVADPHRLLQAAYGWGLDDRTGCKPGIQVDGWANLLVLDARHPTLFPGDDLVRTLAYGSTHGAIKWCVVAGQVRGHRHGLTAEILESDVYRETLSEARARRDELFERARNLAAPSSS